jgi:hypothetical protein
MRVAAPGLSTPGTSTPKTVRGVRLSRLTPAQSRGTVRWALQVGERGGFRGRRVRAGSSGSRLVERAPVSPGRSSGPGRVSAGLGGSRPAWVGCAGAGGGCTSERWLARDGRAFALVGGSVRGRRDVAPSPAWRVLERARVPAPIPTAAAIRTAARIPTPVRVPELCTCTDTGFWYPSYRNPGSGNWAPVTGPVTGIGTECGPSAPWGAPRAWIPHVEPEAHVPPVAASYPHGVVRK